MSKTREELLDDLARAYVEAAVSEGLANYASHTTRSSDSSLYDEVCTVCGAKDYAGGKDELSERPCRGGPRWDPPRKWDSCPAGEASAEQDMSESAKRALVIFDDHGHEDEVTEIVRAAAQETAQHLDMDYTEGPIPPELMDGTFD